MDKPVIVCLVGESGSGKTTLAESMEEFGYTQILSYTTRPKRYPEENTHTFVDTEEFDQIRDDLIAYTIFDGYEYGATKKQLLGNHLYVIDPDGVKTFTNRIGRENFKVIYLSTDEDIRYKRMIESRGKKQAEDRLNHDRQAYAEFLFTRDYDISLSNNTEEELIDNKFVLSTLLNQWFPTN